MKKILILFVCLGLIVFFIALYAQAGPPQYGGPGDTSGFATLNSSSKVVQDPSTTYQTPQTTISGYGITNAYTKTEADASYASVLIPVVLSSVSGNLTAAQAKGSYVILDSSAWMTLPAGVTGMSLIIDVSDNTVVCVDVSGSTEFIRLNGVDLAAGNKVCSPASSPGESISMIFTGNNRWVIPGRSSLWTDES